MDRSLTLLSNNKSNLKIKQASLELFKIDTEYKKYKSDYEQRKKELQNIIFSRGYDEFALDTPNIGKYLKVKPVESHKIIWNIEKLKNKIGKSLFNKVSNKTYTINNFNGLVEFLKSYGVDPKEFQKYLTVDVKIDNKKIDELGELGDITRDDLTDCYTLEKISEYIKFSEIDTEGNEKED